MFLRRKEEHFLGLLSFAKKANKLRKILKKFNKLFKRTKKIKEASVEVPKKIEKEVNKQIKDVEKDINESVKETESDMKKESKKVKTTVDIKKEKRGILDSVKDSIAKFLNKIKRGLNSIGNFIKKLPKRIAELLFSPFKNIKRHLTIKNGKFILFSSVFIVIILGSLSDSIAYLLDLQGNLIVTGILNFIGVFIITFLSFAMKMKSTCKISSMSQLFSRLPVKTLLKVSLAISTGTILTSYQIFGSFLNVINSILENFGDVVQKIAAIKESLILGGVYLVTSVMSPIPQCGAYI